MIIQPQTPIEFLDLLDTEIKSAQETIELIRPHLKGGAKEGAALPGASLPEDFEVPSLNNISFSENFRKHAEAIRSKNLQL